MSDKVVNNRNWFNQGGQEYARFRPEYPPELAQFLASVSPGTQLALDVGCGTGQLAVQLVKHFDAVLATDASVEQLVHATEHARIKYVCAPAEQLPVDDSSIHLIMAAQAAHWFDLPLFYEDVRRVGVSNAILALVSYGVPQLDDDLNTCFSHFYWQEIGPYWPAQRKLVDTGYVDIPFPFRELAYPSLTIHKIWSLAQLLGYISTWSSVRSVREAGREDILHAFAAEVTALWGDPTRGRDVRWPINMRLGSL